MSIQDIGRGRSADHRPIRPETSTEETHENHGVGHARRKGHGKRCRPKKVAQELGFQNFGQLMKHLHQNGIDRQDLKAHDIKISDLVHGDSKALDAMEQILKEISPAPKADTSDTPAAAPTPAAETAPAPAPIPTVTPLPTVAPDTTSSSIFTPDTNSTSTSSTSETNSAPAPTPEAVTTETTAASSDTSSSDLTSVLSSVTTSLLDGNVDTAMQKLMEVMKQMIDKI